MNRAASDLASSYKEFKSLVSNSALKDEEIVDLWSAALVAPDRCAISMPRRYLAVLSVFNDGEVESCVDKASFLFRGTPLRFHEFFMVPVSKATEKADSLLIAMLRDCAPVGHMDRRVRNCVLGRFGWEKIPYGVAAALSAFPNPSDLAARPLAKPITPTVQPDPPPPAPRVVSEARLQAEIECVQSGLRRLGFNPGPVDGKLGRRTLAAAERASILVGGLQKLSRETTLDWCRELNAKPPPMR